MKLELEAQVVQHLIMELKDLGSKPRNYSLKGCILSLSHTTQGNIKVAEVASEQKVTQSAN